MARRRLIALAAVAGALAGPGLARAAPPLFRPNPVLASVAVDYQQPLVGTDGTALTLGPLRSAVIAQALADQSFLAYQQESDLGGFVPADVGKVALSSGGTALVGRSLVPQIPKLAEAAGGKIKSFAFLGGTSSGTASSGGAPDNGTGTLPGVGVPPATPPPTGTNTVPPPNQGFGGSPPTSPSGTTTTPRGGRPAATTSTGAATTSTGAATTTPHGTTTGTTTPPTTTTAPTAPTTTRPTTTTAPTTTRTAPTTTAPTTTTSTTTTNRTTTTGPPPTTGGTATTPPPTGSGTTTGTASTTTTPGGGGSSGGGTDCGANGISITSDLTTCRIYAVNMEPGGRAVELLTVRNDTSGAFDLSLRAAGVQNRFWNDLRLGVWAADTAAPDPLPPLAWWTGQSTEIASLAAGSSIRLEVELYLPSSVGNEDQDQAAVVDLVWHAQG